LNPVEILKESRDSRRASDLEVINKALSIYDSTVSGGVNGAPGLVNTTIYISLPDTGGGSACGEYTLLPPTPPPYTAYLCAAEANHTKIDSNGWIPINFTTISTGAPFAKLPTDPIQNNDPSYYYTFTKGSSWKLTALFEAKDHEIAINDGGTMPGVLEIGTDISLGPNTRDQGLVGYWKFDGDIGTTALDSSGKGNTGTLIGGNFHSSDCKISLGLCISLDGSSNYITIPDSSSLNLGGDLTILVWIKPNGLPTNSGQRSNLVSKGYYADFQLGYILEKTQMGQENDPRSIHFFHGDGSNFQGLVILANSISNLDWQQIGVIRDTSQKKLIGYRNAVQGLSTSYSQEPSAISTPTYIGARLAGSQLFKGAIDEVRIYNRALSQNEIQAIYNAQK